MEPERDAWTLDPLGDYLEKRSAPGADKFDELIRMLSGVSPDDPPDIARNQRERLQRIVQCRFWIYPYNSRLALTSMHVIDVLSCLQATPALQTLSPEAGVVEGARDRAIAERLQARVANRSLAPSLPRRSSAPEGLVSQSEASEPAAEEL